jgi:RNA polymerase sigma-70 factor (ECF subfamily)
VHGLDQAGRERLERVYREHGPYLWRAIYASSGGRRDVADEAVAEAFAQAGRGLGRIRELRPWLYRAAFRIAAGELKRRPPGPPAEEGPTDEGGMTELMELARRLSPAQRRAIVLRDVLGFSSRESATLMGTTEVAVRVHLHRARTRLRSMLKEDT